MLSAWRRVNLPRLARPNLVARLYMLFVAQGTVEFAWLVPNSTAAKLIATGGMLAVVMLWVLTVVVAFGLIDVILNDVCQIDELRRGPRWVRGFARWIKSRRIDRCYIIGGVYLLQAYAGMDSQVPGVLFLLVYYLKMAVLAGFMVWSLHYLDIADVSVQRVP